MRNDTRRVEEFLKAIKRIDAHEAAVLFFALIGVEASLIDKASARHAEHAMESCCAVRGDGPEWAASVTWRYLAPEAAYYERVDEGRAMIMALPSEGAKAKGYEKIFEVTKSCDDALASLTALAGAATSPGQTDRAATRSMAVRIGVAAKHRGCTKALALAEAVAGDDGGAAIAREYERLRSDLERPDAARLREVREGYW